MTARRDAGFTLLEVLVALVVFGFLILGLQQGVDFGLRSWGRQTRSIAAGSELDAVDRALRGLIARLDPASGVTGAAHGMAFTSALPQAAALPGSPEADMALGVDGRRRLMLRWTPHIHAQAFGPAPPAQEAELLQGIERLDLAYWPRAGGGWQETWTDRSPPTMIRIRVVFSAVESGRGDQRHWADIIASPARELPGN